MSTRTLRDYFASLPIGDEATFVSPGLKQVGTETFANRAEVDNALSTANTANAAAQSALSQVSSSLQSVVAGSANVTVNNTDPRNPIISVAASGSGTVTSIGLTVPTGLSVTPASITMSGTFAITYASGYQGYTAIEAGKLAGIATGATANQTDAYLLARANHTGTQTASTISDFSTSADARISAAVGVSVQAYSAKLGALAGQTWAADQITYQTGAGTVGVTSLTAFGRSLIDDTSNTAARATLGLGTSATMDKATAAQVRSATADKIVTADLVPSACAIVSLTDAATVALDWASGIVFDVALTANRTIGNPTNVQVGTYRTLIIKSSSSTARTPAYGSNFKGIPSDSVTNTSVLIVTIFALSSTQIICASKKVDI